MTKSAAQAGQFITQVAIRGVEGIPTHRAQGLRSLRGRGLVSTTSISGQHVELGDIVVPLAHVQLAAARVVQSTAGVAQAERCVLERTGMSVYREATAHGRLLR